MKKITRWALIIAAVIQAINVIASAVEDRWEEATFWTLWFLAIYAILWHER